MNLNNKPSQFIRLLRKFRESKRSKNKLIFECKQLNNQIVKIFEQKENIERKLNRLYSGDVSRIREKDNISLCISINGDIVKHHPEIIDYAVEDLVNKMRKVVNK
jgi:CII-binding regulator of phage lambda lysogenization HflD